MGVYVAFAQKKFRSSMAYRFNNMMSIVYSLLNIFIYMAIFRMMYQGASDVAGITLPMLAANFVLTFIVGTSYSLDDYFLQRKMNDGSIANEFLRPVNLKLRILAESIGETIYSLIFQGVPTLLIVYYMFPIEMPSSFAAVLEFLVTLVLGYLILWSISFLVQTTSFFIVNVWSISTIKNVFIHILSGVYLPVWFFPDWLKKIISFTPFKSIYYVPIECYLGRVNMSEFLLCVLNQMMWLAILLLLGDFAYKKGKKKLIVQGG